MLKEWELDVCKEREERNVKRMHQRTCKRQSKREQNVKMKNGSFLLLFYILLFDHDRDVIDLEMLIDTCRL
jgi:hypothetical protein